MYEPSLPSFARGDELNQGGASAKRPARQTGILERWVASVQHSPLVYFSFTERLKCDTYVIGLDVDNFVP